MKNKKSKRSQETLFEDKWGLETRMKRGERERGEEDDADGDDVENGASEH